MLSTNDNSSSPDKSQTPTQTQPEEEEEDTHSVTVQQDNNSPHHSNENEASSSVPDDTSDVLAKGVSSIIGNVMKDFDFKADNAVKSQDQLSSAIDRLTGELDQLLEDAPVPFIMQQAAKISGVRKRVSSLNSLLKSIQRRIDNIDRMLSTGSAHEWLNPTSKD